MNDSRITAYAVGELDPAEREAFERELAASAELQRELAETIALADALPASLSNATDTLGDERRRALVAKFSEPKKRSAVRVWLPALAACLLTALALLSLMAKRESRKSDLAMNELRGVDLATGPTVMTKSGSGVKKLQLAQENRKPAEFDQPASAAVVSKDSLKSVEIPSQPAEQFAKAEKEFNNAEITELRPAGTAATAGSPADQLARQEQPLVARAIPVTPAPPGQLPSVTEKFDGFAVNGAPVADADEEVSKPVSSPATLAKTRQADATGLAGQAALADVPLVGRLFRSGSDFNTESYDSIVPNEFLDAKGNPLSTFSIDVDTASYANVRRFLNADQRPPAGAVRIEELINYFPYAYPQPEGDAPFSITTDVAKAPWNPEHLLARIALKGRDIEADKLPPSNLVFLIDVSGSMDEPDKLPLLKRALRGLVDRLSPRDSVAMAVYAGSSGLVLPPTDGADKTKILAALDRLEAGGSTNGASGIQLAYDTARKNLLKEGNNRVILCTDGDFNVGTTSQSELVELIERERKSGVFLSVLGFGTGNVKDSTMEKLADKGNGNYAYIDSPAEARKVLVEQMGATLFTIAKDVKVQVEFNPATVAGYRLIGYENRLLAKEDFNDDTKDAGEIGAGHTVTALYEIIPAGQALPNDRTVDPLKYQPIENRESKIENSRDLFTVKLRYKQPDGDTSKLLEKPVGGEVVEFDAAPADFRFATAVAAFGMKLRGGKSDAAMDWDAIQKIARGSLGDDPGSYRAEFLTLIEKARHLPGAE